MPEIFTHRGAYQSGANYTDELRTPNNGRKQTKNKQNKKSNPQKCITRDRKWQRPQLPPFTRVFILPRSGMLLLENEPAEDSSPAMVNT